MLVVLALAAVAILGGVVSVAMGRGGEMAEFPPDVPPLDLPAAGQLGAVDFVALQLPVSLVGYHTQSVDETLHRAAGAISARDTRIAVLEQRVTELLAHRLHARQEAQAGPPPGEPSSPFEHRPQGPEVPPSLPEPVDAAPEKARTPETPETPETPHTPDTPDTPEASENSETPEPTGDRAGERTGVEETK
ncbi:hypothetical protein [Spongiactinospora sp. TRM90649]|uniref:hypothetical protein n=1 Tax=Spongiactinospora sp. TRM90649 TaxID=3031114 RepID=UPI0023F98F98|nr:hypothetical protein [Spongiactinospora sp. TRM90649]MDF5755449.1 hypothetical protein [Spongiactinospora sp. TRM90649]